MISFVGAANEYRPTSEVTDLGDGAIIPGLVNAHTHLEFSHMTQPLGQLGIKFTDWIRLIVKSRVNSADTSHISIQSGVRESLDAGVVAIGEIATMPFDVEDYLAYGLSHCLIFLEQLGSDRSLIDSKRQELDRFLNFDLTHSFLNFGASPHAPYSCNNELVSQICEQAAKQNRIVAMHVAETMEERELLSSQSGDFVELLKDFGVWDAANFLPGLRSIQSTLEQLATTKSLVIHGNYLKADELDFIANHRDMTIVFCPRTHQFFGHLDYPLFEMRKRSIRVAVGTDSRASNPDLNLIEELKLIARSFPELDCNEILKMGTLQGAEALNIDSKLGSLTVGKVAAMSFVHNENEDMSRRPENWLFETSSKARRVG